MMASVQNTGNDCIGNCIARNFGDEGVWQGEVKAAEQKGKRNQWLYRVEYTDGDVEDMDQEELNYAMELWVDMFDIDYWVDDSGSEDEDKSKTWKRPKVSFFQLPFFVLLFHLMFFNIFTPPTIIFCNFFEARRLRLIWGRHAPCYC